MIPPPGECHLWLVPVRPRAGWLPLLDPAERARAERLAGTPAAAELVTSRAAQRLIGARYLGGPPAAVRTDRSCTHCGARGHGPPRFVGRPDLVHSVAHAGGWLLVAVTGGAPVGVDLEAPGAARDPVGLARASLTPDERRRCAELPAAERPGWLLSAWTRKEAAMKLTGLGLRAAPRLVDVAGPRAVADGVPGWPAGPVLLRDLPLPDGCVGALATTRPVTRLRWRSLPAAVEAAPVPAGMPDGAADLGVGVSAGPRG
ncbi:4'-phosphopantetheinyl transferase superfamily protein [Streptomyces sp. DSM 44915]|uniref:4'-phosphopantetheinyl transferase superfamily protein n=1 Tax=Streptomyces chisholmiae TaxID=3075540 RepID=A0ABU2JQV0_9ACTN|nr:4'-phosphopantetheinyl transferase superfamily protein [Streptomyces sp. DSM 44915]MDT0267359.1 4'-phosphopantetheinyl transferase superfamily protein [Streptomyces sp. DSM 44915]